MLNTFLEQGREIKQYQMSKKKPKFMRIQIKVVKWRLNQKGNHYRHFHQDQKQDKDAQYYYSTLLLLLLNSLLAVLTNTVRK